jgi:hypothetical protein
MKREMYLVLLLAFSISISKAQTKEETVEWITEKLKANMEGYYFSKSVLYYRYTPTDFTIDECQLTVNILEESSYSGGGSWEHTITVPLQDLIIRNDGTFYNFGIQKVTTATTYRDKSSIGAKGTLNDSKGNFKINLDKERDILERMRKAFKHLATFCPPKKKETF